MLSIHSSLNCKLKCSVESFTDWKFTQLIITLVYFISSILNILCFSNVNITANLAFKHNAKSVIAIIQLENSISIFCKSNSPKLGRNYIMDQNSHTKRVVKNKQRAPSSGMKTVCSWMKISIPSFQSLKNMCVKSFCFLHGKAFISNSYIQVTHVIVTYSSVSNQKSKSKKETDKAFKKD